MKNNVFASLDGTPAHILIIVGLVLALYAPLIPSAKWARVAKAEAAVNRAESLVNSEYAKFVGQADTNSSDLPWEQQMARQEEQSKANEAKRKELEETYELERWKQESLDARYSAAGTRSHLYVGWLGDLLLVLGLLVMTVQSEGRRQIVLLIILLVVLFSAVTGVNLDFNAEAHMGQLPMELQEALRSSR